MPVIQKISKYQFEQYRETYRRMVEKSPIFCDLEITTTINSTGSFTNFTGDNQRLTTKYNFPCLYNRNIAQNERIKYGLHESVTGILYLSPTHLQNRLGSFKLDKRKVVVYLTEEKFIVDTIVYLSPMYNSCLTVEIRLTDWESK